MRKFLKPKPDCGRQISATLLVIDCKGLPTLLFGRYPLALLSPIFFGYACGPDSKHSNPCFFFFCSSSAAISAIGAIGAMVEGQCLALCLVFRVPYLIFRKQREVERCLLLPLQVKTVTWAPHSPLPGVSQVSTLWKRLLQIGY